MHYFESRAHKAAVTNAFHQGKLPLKFAYAGSASETHERLSRSDGYRASNWQVESEVARLMSCGVPDKLEVIDFGPGDGVHSSLILSALAADHSVMRYTGVDFSRSLFVQARRVLAAEHPNLRVDFQWADLEQPFSLIHDPLSACSVLFLAIGGLFGNVEDYGTAALNIFDAVPTGCLGLVSVSALLTSVNTDEYVEPYRTPVFRDAALEPLRAAGFVIDDAALTLTWDVNARAVVGVVELQAGVEDHRLSNPTQRSTDSTEWRQVRVFLSRRFTLTEISGILESVGFVIVDIGTDESGRRIDAIVRKP